MDYCRELEVQDRLPVQTEILLTAHTGIVSIKIILTSLL